MKNLSNVKNLKIERFYIVTETYGPMKSGYKKQSWKRPNTVGWHNGWAQEVKKLQIPYLSVKLSDGHWYKPHKFITHTLSKELSNIILKEKINSWEGKTFQELIDFLKNKFERVQ